MILSLVNDYAKTPHIGKALLYNIVPTIMGTCDNILENANSDLMTVTSRKYLSLKHKFFFTSR